MKNLELGQVVGERSLLDSQSGKRIVVRVGLPRPFSGEGGWFCPYEIDAGDPQVRYAAGLDALQALQLVMWKIGVEVHILNEQSGGTLEWNGEPDLGFPTQPPPS